MTNLDQKGFTLIEVLIVIAMMSIMLVAAGYYLGNAGNKAQLRSAARDLASNMNLARVKAIRDGSPWAIQFDPDTNRYRILSGAGETDPDPLDWDDGDEITFRTAALPQNIAFGRSIASTLDLSPGTPIPVDDGVSDEKDRIIFNANGSCSESAAAYFRVFNDTSLSNDGFAVSTLAATGRVKIQKGTAGVWAQ